MRAELRAILRFLRPDDGGGRGSICWDGNREGRADGVMWRWVSSTTGHSVMLKCMCDIRLKLIKEQLKHQSRPWASAKVLFKQQGWPRANFGQESLSPRPSTSCQVISPNPQVLGPRSPKLPLLFLPNSDAHTLSWLCGFWVTLKEENASHLPREC